MRNRLMSLIFVVTAVLAFSRVTVAQTAQQRAAGGKSIPRTPDGKPNFTGLWEAVSDNPAPGSSVFQTGSGSKLPTRADRGKELPYTPAGRAAYQYAIQGDGEYAGETGAPEDPRFNFLPCGPSSPGALTPLLDLFQSPGRLLVVYLGDGNNFRPWIRQMWIGQQHPKDPADYNATWMGHSVAKWEGDALVVDTIGIQAQRKGASSMILDNLAAPQSGQMHMVERFYLANDGTLHIDRTFEDPRVYVRPWTNNRVFKLQPNLAKFADDYWELDEPQIVCPGGTYPEPEDVDPWFENYDKIKILPHAKK